MRTLATAAVLVFAIASPALATRVTNLDQVAHTVTFESAGLVNTRAIAPNATVRFEGVPNGRLSLVTAPNPRTSAPVNADGILSRTIGNGRNQGIPVDIMDDYTIWPGGDIQLQRRMKRYGRN